MSIVVERDNIGIYGCMNVGKSSLLNLIVQQEASIVDDKPGTTADTKIVLCEIHGIGPVRVFDTAGLDEEGALGEKKRKKAFQELKECNVILLVIDPSRKSFVYEEEVIKNARALDMQILIVFNAFYDEDVKNVDRIRLTIPFMQFYPYIVVKANDEKYRIQIINFIINNYQSIRKTIPLLPFLKQNTFYLLVIPMDEETPQGRFLRPQAMVEEYITRHWAYPVVFRLSLQKARGNKQEHNEEHDRFMSLVEMLQKKLHCIITDSQAMDVMSQWCPDDVMITTFSIIMINYQSNGKLKKFVNGACKLNSLAINDKILIAEACNHTRIAEDIGTVQIPNLIQKKIPGIIIEHSFGREFKDIEELKQYSLVIHCGGCMISHQKLQSRIRDLEMVNVPYTNYGIILSLLQGKEILNKVIKPFENA